MESLHFVSDPDILGGTPIPIRVLFEHMQAGESLEVFLEDFPSVTRELAIQVLTGH